MPIVGVVMHTFAQPLKLFRTPLARVYAFVALLAVVLAMVSVIVWELEQPVPGPVMTPPLLFVCFAAVEAWVIHVHFRTEAGSFSLSEIPLVLGVLYASPRSLIIGAMLGAMLGLLVARRQVPVKLLFNMINIGLFCAVTALTYRALAGVGELDRWAWVALFIATIVGSTVNILAIATAIAVTETRPSLSGVGSLLGFGLSVTVGNTAIGLACALLWPEDSFSILVLAVPAGLLFVAYRMFASERARRERVEFLYRSTSGLNSGDDGTAALGAVLDEAREMFRAEVAQAALLSGGDGRVQIRVVQSRAGHQVLAREATMAEAEAVRSAMSDLDEPQLIGEVHDSHVGRLAETVDSRDGLVAKLVTDGRDMGVLIVGNRLGEVSSFDHEDLRLLAALADQIAVSLDNDRLEQALDDLRRLERDLAHQATHDALTGLPNRALFSQRLDEAAVSSEPFAVLMIDLDDFKIVNDTMGHQHGDRLLVEVADRLRGLLRPIDTAARLGGDEFAVLLRGHSNPRDVGERIVSAVCEPIEIDGSILTVGCSIGVTNSTQQWRLAKEILQQADIAMYEVKRRGKRGVGEFTDNDAQPRSIAFQADLRQAISEGELIVRYQPIVDLETGDIRGAEALVRWDSPTRGLLLPGAFIAEAEQDGFIVPIDRWVLGQAAKDLQQLRVDGHEDLFVSVNLSARHLQAHDLVAYIRSQAPDVDGFGGRMVMELTETALMGELDRSLANLNAINALGVRFALDDFGTGYSSIGYLKEFRVDILKIAKPFIDSVAESPRDAAFVKAMVDLGHALDLSIVAEGIEADDQAEALISLGCDQGQGFLLARPMSFADLRGFIQAERRTSVRSDVLTGP
jgi:diguanylate cyclase (GGDEF)-like protein